MPDEEELLEADEAQRPHPGADVAVDVDDVFALGAGTGDMWGEPEDRLGMTGFFFGAPH